MSCFVHIDKIIHANYTNTSLVHLEQELAMNTEIFVILFSILIVLCLFFD